MKFRGRKELENEKKKWLALPIVLNGDFRLGKMVNLSFNDSPTMKPLSGSPVSSVGSSLPF